MTAPNANIKVSGAWKTVNKMHVKVSGTWKRVNSAYVRVSGAWKKFLQSVSPCTFAAGALGGSASEYTPITGTARAVTVPSGNSGTLEIRNVVNSTGSITCEWRIGAGSWASVTVTTQRTFSDTNTIQFRVATGQGATEYFYADVYDVDTNTFVRQAGFSWT